VTSDEKTCWTLIRDAAGGDGDARGSFARLYLPVVRAYLGARWRGGPLLGEMDDAVQDVFLECFRDGGALGRARADGPGRFRTFLYAVVRNVARRVEEKRGRERLRRSPDAPDAEDLSAHEERLSFVFDRSWAETVLRHAAERQAETARKKGPEAIRRIELMRLRFNEDRPIREIARMWNEDAAVLHHEYARAREEFKTALREEVGFHHSGTPGDIDRECRNLLRFFG